MTDKIYIGIDDKRIEAKGEVLEQILKDQAEYAEQKRLVEAELQAKKATLDSAIAKLAKLGLTEDEAKAIIGLQ
jgi:Mn-dependent DtxR family transcriptional regulator